jgi:hypothetical protein
MENIKGYFNHYRIELEIKRLPSDVYGLSYRPSVEPVWQDDADYYAEWGSKDCVYEIQDVDRGFIMEFLSKHKNQFRTIVEIGVCRRNLETSWTKYFIELKHLDCFYIGVDANDKSFLNNVQNKVYTIKAWSSELDGVLQFIEKTTGRKKIDLLFVDGNHSIQATYNDFRYVQYLSDGGVVLFHDVSVHPAGLVFDAIDDKLFRKEKMFLHHPQSSGVGIAYKR